MLRSRISLPLILAFPSLKRKKMARFLLGLRLRENTKRWKWDTDCLYDFPPLLYQEGEKRKENNTQADSILGDTFILRIRHLLIDMPLIVKLMRKEMTSLYLVHVTFFSKPSKENTTLNWGQMLTFTVFTAFPHI